MPRHGVSGAKGMPAIPVTSSFPRNTSAGDLLDMPKLPMGAAMMSAEPQRLQVRPYGCAQQVFLCQITRRPGLHDASCGLVVVSGEDRLS